MIGVLGEVFVGFKVKLFKYRFFFLRIRFFGCLFVLETVSLVLFSVYKYFGLFIGLMNFVDVIISSNGGVVRASFF